MTESTEILVMQFTNFFDIGCKSCVFASLSGWMGVSGSKPLFVLLESTVPEHGSMSSEEFDKLFLPFRQHVVNEEFFDTVRKCLSHKENAFHIKKLSFFWQVSCKISTVHKQCWVKNLPNCCKCYQMHLFRQNQFFLSQPGIANKI